MATDKLKNIFLSASIPFKERHPQYYKTADIIAIRDSVIALVTTVLPHFRLIWGGHPSITPIIYYVMDKLALNVQEHVLLYQSEHFKKTFPEDNQHFQNIIFTEDFGERNISIEHMRTRMFQENHFDAAVFIGGMEGIEDEFKMFNDLFPKAISIPLASTGGAAKRIYDNSLSVELKDERFLRDYGYMSLFQELIIDKIKI